MSGCFPGAVRWQANACRKAVGQSFMVSSPLIGKGPAEQRKTVGARVPPVVPGLSEGVEQTFTQWHECSVVRRRIEVAPDDHRSRHGNTPHIDQHVFDLAAVLDPIIAMIPPESRAPEVETKYGRIQPDADHVRLESAEQLDARMDNMRRGVHATCLQVPAR
jgi:hypothetical protein